MPPQSITAPRIGNAFSPLIVPWGCLLSAAWLLPSPYVQMRVNRPMKWSDCGNISCLLQRVLLTPPNSVDLPWPCIWQVLSATPPCTSPVIGERVHLEQQQVLPCKLVLPPPGFLHQGILKGSTWRDVQGLTWPSLALVLRSTFDTLSFAWQPHYGAGVTTWTGPILASGWWSNRSAPYVVHLGNNWPQRVWSATLVKHPVLWA